MAEFNVAESIAAMADYVTKESESEFGGHDEHEVFLNLLAKFSPDSGSEIARVANEPATVVNA